MSLPPNSDTDEWVSWEQYNRLIEQLALSIHESGWKFDKIVCLARGGISPDAGSFRDLIGVFSSGRILLSQ